MNELSGPKADRAVGQRAEHAVASAERPVAARPRADEPLSELELDELDEALERFSEPRAMRLEELDGFFSALNAGPPVAKPCQYWPVVLGHPVGHEKTLEFIRQSQALLALFARHWHTVATSLDRGDVYAPQLRESENGAARGCAWARGFMQAVSIRRAEWAQLLDNELEAGAVLPMLILSHEGHPDPQLRSAGVNSAQREELLDLMAGGLWRVRRFFRGPAPAAATASTATPRAREAPRPDAPCSCGSGKRFSECCDAARQPRVH